MECKKKSSAENVGCLVWMCVFGTFWVKDFKNLIKSDIPFWPISGLPQRRKHQKGERRLPFLILRPCERPLSQNLFKEQFITGNRPSFLNYAFRVFITKRREVTALHSAKLLSLKITFFKNAQLLVTATRGMVAEISLYTKSKQNSRSYNGKHNQGYAFHTRWFAIAIKFTSEFD